MNIVYCKECKYSRPGWHDGLFVCNRPINFDGDKLALDMKADDYCSRGEKNTCEKDN